MTYKAIQHAALALGLTGILAAQGVSLRGEAYGRSTGWPVATADGLELRVASSPAGGTCIQLLGGVPDNQAVIFIAGAPSDLEAVQGTRLYLDAPSVLARGQFDSQGRFELPIAAGLEAGTVYLQGLHAAPAAAGLQPTLQTSHGLLLRIVAETSETCEEQPDFTLLRIELGRDRSGDFSEGIANLDLPAILRAALNSPGDSLDLELGGKITVPAGVPGVAIGGKVKVAAKVCRTPEGFELSIGKDIGIVCGLKATDDIGLEGGRSVGIELVHSFSSIADTAKGIRSLALITALGRSGHLANQHSQKILREARQLRSEIHDRIHRLLHRRWFRNSRLQRALERILAARERAYLAARRAGAAARRAVDLVVDSRRFLMDHFEAIELRTECSGEVSLKIEGAEIGSIGAGLEGARKVAVRIHSRLGHRPHAVRATVIQAMSAKIEASLGSGFEAQREIERGLELAFIRKADGRFQLETDVLFLSTGLKLVAVSGMGVKQKLGIGRKTSLSVSLRDLKSVGRETLMAAFQGKAGAAAKELLALPATIAVQDHVFRALAAGFGGGAAGAAGEIKGSASWSDQGPSRSLEFTVPEMIERLLHSDPVEAAGRLVESFESVRATL